MSSDAVNESFSVIIWKANYFWISNYDAHVVGDLAISINEFKCSVFISLGMYNQPASRFQIDLGKKKVKLMSG